MSLMFWNACSNVLGMIPNSTFILITLFRKRKGGIKLSSDEEEVNEEGFDLSAEGSDGSDKEDKLLESQKEQKDAADKAKQDTLWAAFKSDVQSSTRKPQSITDTSQKVQQCIVCSVPEVAKVIGINNHNHLQSLSSIMINGHYHHHCQSSLAIIINYYCSLSIIINHHHLSSSIITIHYQSSSVIINHHNRSSVFLGFISFMYLFCIFSRSNTEWFYQLLVLLCTFKRVDVLF